jgi:hypothetical protein
MILVAAAHALHEIEQAKVHHIAVDEPRLDWGALIDREKIYAYPTFSSDIKNLV